MPWVTLRLRSFICCLPPMLKAGVRAAGGTPVEFPAIAVCDGIAMGHVGMKYSLVTSRCRNAYASLLRGFLWGSILSSSKFKRII